MIFFSYSESLAELVEVVEAEVVVEVLSLVVSLLLTLEL